MFNLNYFSSTFYLLIFYFLNLPLGYLLLHLKETKTFSRMPLGARLPIYLSFGLIFSSLIKYLLGLIHIYSVTPIIISLTAFLLLAVKARKEKRSIFLHIGHIDLDSIFFVVLFLFSFTFFVFAVGTLRWPPWGDITYHGTYTSLMRLHEKTAITWEPIGGWDPVTRSLNPQSVLSYPLGFQSEAAYLSLLLNIYPGEAVFLLGTGICILIPLVLSSLTYLMTRSKLFSAITFFSTFLYHPSGHNHYWIFGYYYNGPYPFLFGLLSIFTFCILIAIYYRDKNEPNSLHILLISSLMAMQLLITYPVFCFFVIASFFSQIGLVRKGIMWLFSTRRGNITSILSLLLFLLFYILSKDFLNPIIFSYLRGFWSSLTTPLPYFSIKFLYDSIIGISILIGAVTAVFLLTRKIYSGISFFYLIIFLPFLLSLTGITYFGFLTPNRSIMINAGLSWVLISVTFKYVHFNIPNIRKITIKFTKLKKINTSYMHALYDAFLVTMIVLLTLYGFYPSLEAQFSLKPASYFSFRNARGPGFEDDFKALEFINEHIPSSDLILNDISPTSVWVNSFSIKNLTFYKKVNRPVEEYKELKMAWESPNNALLLRRLIEKYRIKFIFVTSDMYTYDWPGWGGTPVPKTKSNYTSIFDNYSFLNPVFKSGNTRVYETFLNMEERYVSWLEDFRNISKWPYSTWNIGEATDTFNISLQQSEDVFSVIIQSNNYDARGGIILSHSFEKPLSLYEYHQLEFRAKTNGTAQIRLYFANETHMDSTDPALYIIPKDWSTQSFNILSDVPMFYDRIWRMDILLSGQEKTAALHLDWIKMYGYKYAFEADELTGAGVKDLSAYNYQSMIYSANWANEKTNYALSFDGVDDYVDCGNSESLNTQVGTVELWLKSATAEFDRYDPVLYYNDGNNFLFLRFYPDKWGVYCRVGGQTLLDEHEVPYMSGYNLTTFNHFTVTQNGTTMRFYHNGNLMKSISSTCWSESTGSPTLFIGKGILSNTYTNGIINEIRIYNVTLSQVEIHRNMMERYNPIRGGLVLWLPLKEGMGIVAYDMSGQGNDGLIYGATWMPRESWDQVVINLKVFDDRVNIDDEAIVFYEAFYDYDGEPFCGSIVLNDTVFSQDFVGKRGYKVIGVVDEKHGLTAFTSDEVYVIFDKVLISLSVNKESQYGPFSRPFIQTEAFYAYDNATYDGVVTFNDTLSQNLSGKYAYAVSLIEGGRYEITVFDSNTVIIEFADHPPVYITYIICITLIALVIFLTCRFAMLLKKSSLIYRSRKDRAPLVEQNEKWENRVFF